MSIDRYLNIVHEVWYRRYRKSRNAFIVCLLIWTGKKCWLSTISFISVALVSGVFMFPYGYIFGSNELKKNQSSTDCTVNDSSFFSSCVFTFTFYYILPLAIIGLCYSRVLIHIRRSGCSIVKRLVRIVVFFSSSVLMKAFYMNAFEQMTTLICSISFGSLLLLLNFLR